MYLVSKVFLKNFPISNSSHLLIGSVLFDTFFQIQENNEIRSRLDYALIPHELKNSWHSAKIYLINKKISDDHRPIGVTIRTQITREFINKIKEIKQTKMNVKDIEDKTIEKIKEMKIE